MTHPAGCECLGCGPDASGFYPRLSGAGCYLHGQDCDCDADELAEDDDGARMQAALDDTDMRRALDEEIAECEYDERFEDAEDDDPDEYVEE